MGFIKDVTKNAMLEFGLRMGRLGMKTTIEKLREELLDWEKRDIPLNYHNINALFERLSKETDYIKY